MGELIRLLLTILVCVIVGGLIAAGIHLAFFLAVGVGVVYVFIRIVAGFLLQPTKVTSAALGKDPATSPNQTEGSSPVPAAQAHSSLDLVPQQERQKAETEKMAEAYLSTQKKEKEPQLNSAVSDRFVQICCLLLGTFCLWIGYGPKSWNEPIYPLPALLDDLFHSFIFVFGCMTILLGIYPWFSPISDSPKSQ